MNPRNWKKARAAATVFVMLDEDAATDVLRHLNPSEIERLYREISTCEPPTSEGSGKYGELERLLDAGGFPEAPAADIPQQHTQVEDALKRSEVEEGLHLVNAIHVAPSVYMNNGKPGVERTYGSC